MTSGNVALHRSANRTVSAEMIEAFIGYAARMGANREHMDALLNEGLKRGEPPSGHFSIHDFQRIVALAKEQTGQPGLPLHFAANADFSRIALSGLIANSSATMSEALAALNKYASLTVDTPIHGHSPLSFERKETADWIVDQRIHDKSFPELIEITFTYLITGPRRFLPRDHVDAVYLKHTAPAHRETYIDVWDVEVEFEADQNAIRLPKWGAEHPVNLQPDYAKSILTSHADLLLEKTRKYVNFSDELKHIMRPALSTGDVSIRWIASQLGVSRQAIYRRLSKEHQTFEALRDDLRLDIATEMLREKSNTISNIAYELGFTDASSFSRAFKRWTGVMPGAYRSEGDG